MFYFVCSTLLAIHFVLLSTDAMPIQDLSVERSLHHTWIVTGYAAGSSVEDPGTKGSMQNTDYNQNPQQNRVKRTPRLPETFSEDMFKNSGLSGSIVYVARKSCHISFDVNPETFSNAEILLAELHMYKIRPRSLKFLKRAKAKQTKKARVNIQQVIRAGEYMSETKQLDKRLVHIKASGWLKFDITTAMKDWTSDATLNHGLEIWVESAEPGEFAAKIARKFRFVKPEDKKMTQYRPLLYIVFKETDT